MKFILNNEEIKLTNQLLGGFDLFLVTNEDDNLSYILNFPGLEDVSVVFANLPDWLSYNDTLKELSGTPSGNDAGKLLLNLTVTHKTGVLQEQLEIVVNSSIVLGEGTVGKFTLPIFDQLKMHKDLSDNLVADSCYGNPGVQLNVTDLTGTGFYDATLDKLTNNWFFNDDDWKTLNGDTLYYEAVMDGKKVPKTGNWVTFDNGVFTFEPKQENFGIHPITVNAYDMNGHELVKTKVISVNVKDVNVTNRNDINDVTIKEGKVGSFTLPEFAELSPHMDLSDNVIYSDQHLWGLDLSLNDLSENSLWDLSNNDLSGNWTFFDSDFGTNKGDKLYYSATINGVSIPERNNWITFSKGKFTYAPLHANVGVYTVTVSATDLSGNVSNFSFKLTVEDLHVRNKLVDQEMFTNDVLEIELPEFAAMTNDLSDNVFTTMEGDTTFFGLDLSLNDLSNNQLWDLSNNDLSGNMWNFFDPDFGTNKGDKVLYKAYVNGNLIESHLHKEEGQFITFKNGVLKFMPEHKDNGSYKIKVVTTDLSGNDTVQEFNLLVKSKYVRNDIPDMNIDEGKELEFELPEFKELLSKFDLSDNVISMGDQWGIDLSLNDLSNNQLWDLSNNDLSGNSKQWNFFDDEFASNKGDVSLYEVKMNGNELPSVGSWATFNKGKFVFKPTGKNIGDHVITVTTTDLSGNVAEQEFKLTVNAIVTPYIRSKFDDNTIGLNLSYMIRDNESLSFKLPEFESLECLPRFSVNLVNDFQGNDGIKLNKLDFSKFDTPANLTDNWTFFNPLWLTNEGGELFFTAKIDGVTIPRENNWIIFKNGNFSVNPTNMNVGNHYITLFAYNLSSRFTSVLLTLNIKDTIAPVITLNGDMNITHEAGTAYVDAGGDAHDVVDGRVALVMTQNIDVNMLGLQVIKYVAMDAEGNMTTAERHIEVVDTTAPVISLLGDREVTLRYGAEYVDAGATALDSFEGSVTIVVDNNVDTSNIGIYTVTYSASDSSGNLSMQERTVFVVDEFAPLIELFGDSEVILEQDSVYMDAGATATDGLEGVLEVVVDNQVDSSKAGIYTVTYTATDSSGNMATAVRTVIITSAEAPVIRVFGNMEVVIREKDMYIDAGAEAHDNTDGLVHVTVNNPVDTTKPGVYEVTYTAVDSLGHVAEVKRLVTVTANNLPVLGDIQMLLNTNELFEAVIPVNDLDNDHVTLSVDELPSWLSFNSVTNVLSGTPRHDDEGNYMVTFHATDGRTSVSKIYNLIVVRLCEPGTVSFEKGMVKDITEYGNNTDFVKSVNLKFVEMDAKCVGLVYVAYETGNGGNVVDLEFSDEHKDKLVELEIVTSFKPMFFKYRGNRMLKLCEMTEMSTFEPNRWASEKILKEDYDSGEVVETHRTILQGYFRDLHMNTGCVEDDFDAGICEDPHILTFGGNRLDLPHNDHIYTMINGLGLRINVKCQLIGEGSYAKYFYVNYQGEDFIIDIDDLNIKQSANRVKTKYHMLKSIDYSGNNFIFEKQMRTLIVRSTDGIMELVFNAETRGLLINSRLNFTQENSSGVMMSNYADECELEELTQ